MIDFDLTEDEQLLQKMVRDFARAEIAPHSRRWDEEEHFPSEIIPKCDSGIPLGISEQVVHL